jgi:hypothetical protein
MSHMVVARLGELTRDVKGTEDVRVRPHSADPNGCMEPLGVAPGGAEHLGTRRGLCAARAVCMQGSVLHWRQF